MKIDRLDSNISEHSHLFDELDEQLTAKYNSMVVKLDSSDQLASIEKILKLTKIKLNKVKWKNVQMNMFRFEFLFSFIRRKKKRIEFAIFNSVNSSRVTMTLVDKRFSFQNVFFLIFQLKESEKRPLIFIIPEFESFPTAIFENLITMLRFFTHFSMEMHFEG